LSHTMRKLVSWLVPGPRPTPNVAGTYSFEQHNKGQNLEISEHGMLARRVTSYTNSATYIATPLVAGSITIGDKPMQGFKVTLTIVEDEAWLASLKMGLTTTDPSTLDFSKLQATACCPVVQADFDRDTVDITHNDHGSSSRLARAILPKQHGAGDVISIAFTPHDNKLFIEFNDQVVIDGADLPDQWLQQFNANQQRIFFVVDVHGQTKAVRLSPVGPLASRTIMTRRMHPMRPHAGQAIIAMVLLAFWHALTR
jgi:hypothetical protein